VYFSRFPNHAFTLFWLLHFHPIGANLSRCPFCVSFGLRWVLCLSFRPVRTLTYCAGSLTFGKQHARPVFPLQIGFSVSLSLSRFLLSFISQSLYAVSRFLSCRCPCVFRIAMQTLFAPSIPFSRVPFGCPLWVLVVSVLCSRVAVVSCVWFGLRPQTFRSVFQFLPHLRSPSGAFLLYHVCAVVFSPKTAAKVRLYLGGLLECLKKNAFSL
jgi:hypothetical protein